MNKQLSTIVSPSSANSTIIIPAEAQNKIVDQILVQSGGVGLGVILTLAGAVFIARWLGLKGAIQGWVEKQKIEAEALSELSGAFTLFVSDYRATTTEIKESLLDIRGKLERKR